MLHSVNSSPRLGVAKSTICWYPSTCFNDNKKICLKIIQDCKGSGNVLVNCCILFLEKTNGSVIKQQIIVNCNVITLNQKSETINSEIDYKYINK